MDMRKPQRAGSTQDQTYNLLNNESKSFHTQKSTHEELKDFVDELNNYFERLEYSIFSMFKNTRKQRGIT